MRKRIHLSVVDANGVRVTVSGELLCGEGEEPTEQELAAVVFAIGKAMKEKVGPGTAQVDVTARIERR